MTLGKFLFLSLLTTIALAALTVRASEPIPLPSESIDASAEWATGVADQSHACSPTCDGSPSGNCHCKCRHRCRSEICCAKVEPVTEEKSCWKVGCEKICVPRVVSPWAPGGSGLTLFSWLDKKHGCHRCRERRNCVCVLQPRQGDVRCVRVLESETYEVTKCKCNWDMPKNPPAGAADSGDSQQSDNSQQSGDR